MKKICILILACMLLIVPSVWSVDYIKSVKEIPIEQGYEVILNYPVDEDQIYAKFIDDDTNKFTDVVIENYYQMPDGTIKIKTNYVKADRIVFYYADTFDDWSLAAMDSVCDSSDLQTPDAPDCIFERGYPISMENVRLYENTEKMHMDLRNIGKNPVNIASLQFYYDWGNMISGTLGDLDEGERIMLEPGDTHHYEWLAGRYKNACGQNLFIGMIENQGDDAIAIHNRELECLEYQPTCGDFVCSKYEQFMDCAKDCDNPINLIVTDGKSNGIYFDYSYVGDNCIYQVSNPDGESFTSKESLDNYKGKNLKDTYVRYNNQVTKPINNMFSSYISGDYALDLICYEKGLEISKQSDSIFVCADCMIGTECVGRNTLKGNYYCTKGGVAQEVGFFKKTYLKIKLLFS